MPTSAKAPPKPGWKTTEFWMTATASIAGLVAASGAFPEEHPVMKVAGLVVMALATFGYSVSRGNAKGIAKVFFILLIPGVLIGCGSSSELRAYAENDRLNWEMTTPRIDDFTMHAINAATTTPEPEDDVAAQNSRKEWLDHKYWWKRQWEDALGIDPETDDGDVEGGDDG